MNKVKEFYQDLSGNVEVEYDNGTTAKGSLTVYSKDAQGYATGLIGPDGNDYLIVSDLAPD